MKNKKILHSILLIGTLTYIVLLTACGKLVDSNQQEENEKVSFIEKIDGREHAVQETWEDSYRDILRNIDNNLADPYDLRTYPGSYYYIGIHDFDNNKTPELIIGDGVSVAIFTYDNNTSKKVADVYEPEVWGCINGLHFKDNKLLLVCSGSDGSGYVVFTYDEGDYITGIYDDYSPELATINDKQVGEEEFKNQFNLTELKENESITYIQIDQENRDTLIIEDEKIMIDDLDFSKINW